MGTTTTTQQIILNEKLIDSNIWFLVFNTKEVVTLSEYLNKHKALSMEALSEIKNCLSEVKKAYILYRKLKFNCPDVHLSRLIFALRDTKVEQNIKVAERISEAVEKQYSTKSKQVVRMLPQGGLLHFKGDLHCHNIMLRGGMAITEKKVVIGSGKEDEECMVYVGEGAQVRNKGEWGTAATFAEIDEKRIENLEMKATNHLEKACEHLAKVFGNIELQSNDHNKDGDNN